MNTEFNQNIEDMFFECISVANVQYEDNHTSVFYGDEISQLIPGSISEASPDDYLSVSFLGKLP